MPRGSNPTDRAMRLLEHLAAKPRESMGLTHLALALHMNKATCLTILTTLTSKGYVLQDPTSKTYGLGPSVVALGNAAVMRFPAAAQARDAMRELSLELDLSCSAVGLAADQLVILDRYGSSDPLDFTNRFGQRSPFCPPLGITFIAWHEPSEFQRWLANGEPPLSLEQKAEQHRAVSFARSNGYAVAQQWVSEETLVAAAEHSPDRVDGSEDNLPAALMREARRLKVRYVLTEFERDVRYRVSTISAPVFGDDGRPCLSLVLSGFRWELGEDEIRAFGERLVKQASAVSETLRARAPVFAGPRTALKATKRSRPDDHFMSNGEGGEI
jgi:DNA-binding IclR family transcriptional regulator